MENKGVSIYSIDAECNKMTIHLDEIKKVCDEKKLLEDKNEQLQQENQQLKEEITRLKELNDEKSKLALINHKNASQKEDKIIVLKDRIDKAIQILKLCNSQCAEETIKILKGDKE